MTNKNVILVHLNGCYSGLRYLKLIKVTEYYKLKFVALTDFFFKNIWGSRLLGGIDCTANCTADIYNVTYFINVI